MGTETSYLSYSHMEHGKSLVKFNNPLMGTETMKRKQQYNKILKHVKFNNPLMWTETQFNNIVCLVVAVT